MNKEQMIEKIREVVVIANNPECKTYEEALQEESKIHGCLIAIITSPYSEQYRKIEMATILWDDGIDSSGNERYYCYRNNATFTTVKGKNKILGLPLTLERVMVALNEVDEGYAYSNEYIVYFDPGDKDHDFNFDVICEWKLESEETIKAIYNILCV
jgi:hypothetical protein